MKHRETFPWLMWSIILIIGLGLVNFASAESVQTRIINGSPTTQPWPWMVSLAYGDGNLARGHFCGGVLVAPRFVLTSAHCVADLVETPDKIHVIIGRTNLNDSAGVVIQGDGVIVYPSFNPDTLENDIALIRLSSEVLQFETLPILSPNELRELGADTKATILGWGVTDPYLPIRPAELQQATIPLVPGALCSERLGLDFEASSMICAGVLSSTPLGTDGIDACFGDSGGPLMIQGAHGWRLLGITSWGNLCASDRYWGVYARVTAFYDWISLALTEILYATTAPTISGTPIVGNRLRCTAGIFRGESIHPRTTQWKDGTSKRTLSKRASYRIRGTDSGKPLRCEVTLSNSYGSVLSRSKPTGRVFDRRIGNVFRIQGSKFLSKAGVYCVARKCFISISFRKAVQSAEGLIPTSTKCLLAQCYEGLSWKAAVPSSDDSMRIPLDLHEPLPSRLLVHATRGTPEQQFTSQLTRQ